jgi:IS1 family transposase
LWVKKNVVYVVMALARETGLVVGAQVMLERSFEQMQRFADRLPEAERYCTDAFTLYQDLIWPGAAPHVVSRKKEETHTIESLNANLRTYLKRLARRCRCFSRCFHALERALRLFVYHYNRRQRLIQASPQYRHHLTLLC